jgi:SAM-dependent methyltransferase
MPDYRQIYDSEAERYETLVAAEDYRGELTRALRRLVTLDGARVIEVGMGTGRITRLLLDAGAHVTGYEQSPAMMSVARRQLGDRFEGHVADIRDQLLPPASADIALAGWVLGHFCEWHGEQWRDEVGAVLENMWNALRVGGTLVLIETLGTGAERPQPPNAALAAYYRYLEESWGATREELPTDYRFDSIEAALQSIAFFFGPELERRVREHGWTIVPEWTGLWWRRKWQTEHEP